MVGSGAGGHAPAGADGARGGGALWGLLVCDVLTPTPSPPLSPLPPPFPLPLHVSCAGCQDVVFTMAEKLGLRNPADDCLHFGLHECKDGVTGACPVWGCP